MYDSIALINNDGYGAPELKKSYQGFTLKGFIIAVTIHIALLAGYMLIVYINQAKTKELPKNYNSPPVIIDIDLPPPIDEPIDPVIPKEIPSGKQDLSLLTPVPTKLELADDVIPKTQDELNKINVNAGRDGDSSVYVSNNGNIKIDDSKLDIIIKKDPGIDKIEPPTYRDFEVEKPPECTNLSQVRASMKYPELAIETRQEGKITIRVLVGLDGSVIKTDKIYGPEVFYDEVKDKVMNLQFTPGLQNNKPVKVWVSVPFNFNLK